MTELFQILSFITGMIILYLASEQDEKTRKPLLIIPAMIFIGLNTSLLLGIIILIIGLACLFLLPNKINKIIGKADIFLFSSILLLLILGNPLILVLTWLTIIIMLFNLIKYELKQKTIKKTTPIPLISYYFGAFTTAIIIYLILTIILLTITLTGAI